MSYYKNIPPRIINPRCSPNSSQCPTTRIHAPSVTGHTRTIRCHECQGINSVTRHTRKIRCHGCQGIISVDDSQESVSFGISNCTNQGQDKTITVICKKCLHISSVTGHTRTIRCHGCQGIISVEDSQESVSFGISNCRSQDQNKTITEGRGLHDFNKKISGSISQRGSPSSSQCPTARISDAPPRGKRALLCGISYKNRKFKLRGTTTDVMNMAKLLVQQFSFPTNAILVLAEYMSYEPPTRDSILRAFDWLVKDLQSGDSLVFYFSGHGVRQLEFEGDEIDGFYEAICPLDFETAGLIIDNDINKMIVGPLKPGVILHAIVDACHSGTVLDLRHVYDRNNEEKWKDNYPPSGAYKGTSGGRAICFSACEDHQQAVDTSAFSSQMAGAMTYTFIKAVMENQGITYHGILESMHNDIEEANHSQRGYGMLNRVFNRKMLLDPMLSSSEKFDVNSVFKL